MILWAPSYFLVGHFDTHQLIINTPATIITSLLVVLLRNTQQRGERVVQKKLDAIADGLSDLMEHFASGEEAATARKDPARDVKDLRAVVGLEKEM